MSGAKFIFEMYDMEAKERMDMFYLGEALRSLNFIPTLAVVKKLGGTLKKGEKFISIEEFLPIVHDIGNMKDMGSYEVFVECLRLYDRHENGCIHVADLENVLLNMGKNDARARSASSIVKHNSYFHSFSRMTIENFSTLFRTTTEKL